MPTLTAADTRAVLHQLNAAYDRLPPEQWEARGYISGARTILLQAAVADVEIEPQPMLAAAE